MRGSAGRPDGDGRRHLEGSGTQDGGQGLRPSLTSSAYMRCQNSAPGRGPREGAGSEPGVDTCEVKGRACGGPRGLARGQGAETGKQWEGHSVHRGCALALPEHPGWGTWAWCL